MCDIAACCVATGTVNDVAAKLKHLTQDTFESMEECTPGFCNLAYDLHALRLHFCCLYDLCVCVFRCMDCQIIMMSCHDEQCVWLLAPISEGGGWGSLAPQIGLPRRALIQCVQRIHFGLAVSTGWHQWVPFVSVPVSMPACPVSQQCLQILVQRSQVKDFNPEELTREIQHNNRKRRILREKSQAKHLAIPGEGAAKS